MKLDEIIVSDNVPAELSQKEIEYFQDRYSGGDVVIQISKTLCLRYLPEYRVYALTKDNTVIGWLELDKQVTLFGVLYDTIRFIFVVNEFRKTRVSGAFLVALKRHLPNPLVLGSDKYGGVLFKDGVPLVKALNYASRSDVSILNLDNGEKQPLGDEIPRRPSNWTLVFENNYFPLQHSGFNLFEGAEYREYEDGKL